MAKAKPEADDVLEGKDDVLEGKKPRKAKKPAPAKKTTKSRKAADPEPAAPAKKSKTSGKDKPAAKKARVRAEDVVSTEEVRAAILKCKKLTSYADLAESSGINIRQIRRTARKMRDDGEVTLEKEGTVVYIKKA